MLALRGFWCVCVCVCVFLEFPVYKIMSVPLTTCLSFPQALLLLRQRSAAPEEQHLVEAAKLLVLLNLSFTYLKLEQPARALHCGEQALIIDQKNAKALFRCGQVSWWTATWEQTPKKRWQWC